MKTDKDLMYERLSSKIIDINKKSVRECLSLLGFSTSGLVVGEVIFSENTILTNAKTDKSHFFHENETIAIPDLMDLLKCLTDPNDQAFTFFYQSNNY